MSKKIKLILNKLLCKILGHRVIAEKFIGVDVGCIPLEASMVEWEQKKCKRCETFLGGLIRV